MSSIFESPLSSRAPQELGTFEFVETNHSNTKIIEKEVAPDEKARVLRAAAHFSNAAFGDVTLCSGAGGSNNYHVITSEPEGDLLIRAAIKNNSEEVVRALHQMFEFLRLEGLVVPRYVPSLNGSFVHRDSTTPHSWVAFHFIQSHGYVSGTVDQQRLVGAEIGMLHQSLKAFEDRPEAEGLKKLFNANKARIPMAPAITKEEFIEMATFARICLSDFAASEVAQHSDEVLQAIALLKKLAQKNDPDAYTQIIHRDLHPYNALLLSDRLSWLDFDDCAFGSVFNDLGYALHTFVRQGAFHHGAYNVPQFVNAFFDGYEESNPGITINRDLIIVQALNESVSRMNRVLRWYSENAPPIDDVIARKHMRTAGEVLFIARHMNLLG